MPGPTLMHAVPTNTRATLPAQQRPPRSARCKWAMFAAFLSAVSLTVELSTHICAANLFDSLPDWTWVAAYIFLTVMVLWNEWVLRVQGNGPAAPPPLPAPEHRATLMAGAATESAPLTIPAQTTRQPGWPLAVSMLGSGVALCIALVYTILFLPLLIVSLPGMFVCGVGLCCWSPLINLIVMIGQWRGVMARWDRHTGSTPRRSRVLSLVTGLAVMALLLGRPVVSGYLVEGALHVEHPTEDTVAALRLVGAEPELAQLCYDRDGSIWVTFGRSLAQRGKITPPFQENEGSPWGQSLDSADDTRARKLYYLLTGRPYESIDARRIRHDRDAWSNWNPVIDQTGGELVGRTAPGLSLNQSTMQAVYSIKTDTSHLDWVLRWTNTDNTPAEARMEIVLPEGGVVDGASLWVNGVEQPAHIAPRTLARTAYKDVVVQHHEDPLLVTTRTPQRVVVQCYPVPPNGAIRIRLGISAPLHWQQPDHPQIALVLPAIQQANFALPPALRHTLKLTPVTDWNGRCAPAGSPSDITQTLPATAMLNPPSIPLPTQGMRPNDHPLGPGMMRSSTGPFFPITHPLDVIVAVDTSAGMQIALDAAWPDLQSALSGLPAGSRVRLVDARLESRADGAGASPWMVADRGAEGAESQWKSSLRFEGGTEAVPALTQAWDELAGHSKRGIILWLHGATPDDFGDATGLDNRYRHQPNGPTLVGIQLLPGPDSLLDHLARHHRVSAFVARQGVNTVGEGLAWGAAMLDSTLSVPPLGGRPPGVNGIAIERYPQPLDPRQSSKVDPVRSLEVNSALLQAWYRATPWDAELRHSQQQAMANHLVTPLTGAVVLESKTQYQQEGLEPGAESHPTPSEPEPETWAMLAVAAAAGGLSFLKRRFPRRSMPSNGEAA